MSSMWLSQHFEKYLIPYVVATYCVGRRCSYLNASKNIWTTCQAVCRISSLPPTLFRLLLPSSLLSVAIGMSMTKIGGKKGEKEFKNHFSESDTTKERNPQVRANIRIFRYFIALLILNPYPPKESMAGQSFRQVLIPTVNNPPKDSTPML